MSDRSIVVESYTIGMVATNCYVCYRKDDTDAEGMHHAVVFDPADKGDRIYEALKNENIVVDLILLTHGHFDHIAGVDDLKRLSGAKVGCYEKELALCKDAYLNLSNDYGMHVTITPDILYKDGQVIEVAGMSFEMFATPGHTTGSCCFYCKEGGFVISGDTLFEGSVGRTDFPGGSTSELLNSIKTRLFELPDETDVYSGHGEPTTIGYEKTYNPFII
jgi:glyoxylase-like metal-dependent hydrolase (beta-lactamase superfamily II)